jgi:hypothetical protein
MSKILVFHNQYNVANAPRTLRWRSIIDGLKKEGLDVSVVLEKGFSPPQAFVKRAFNAIFRWPDNHYKWLITTSLKIAKNRLPLCNVVVGVSHPFSSLVLAYLYSKAYGARLVLDIGDPFSGLIKHVNNKFLYALLNLVIEKKVLLKADLIFVTNVNYKIYLVRKFNLPSEKIIVAYPSAND